MANAENRVSHDVIVVGTSAGGIEALKTLVAALPPELPAAILIVWHVPPDQPSVLPFLLGRLTSLAVKAASEGERLQPGHVYLARPDHHLVLERMTEDEGAHFGRLRVTHGPRENLFRPSIDVLFRSAARSYGARVIGVVLTGLLDDGASGLRAIKDCGGVAVVQDPVDADFPSMPINAMKAVNVDYSIPLAEMGLLLARLVGEATDDNHRGRQDREDEDGPKGENREKGGQAVSRRLDTEVRIALEENALESGALELGEPSLYSCPECHGVLMRLYDGPLPRFRCHTGHAYTLNALLTGVAGNAEAAMWNALRALEESELIMDHMVHHLRESGQLSSAEELERRMRNTRERDDLVRKAVLSQELIGPEIL